METSSLCSFQPEKAWLDTDAQGEDIMPASSKFSFVSLSLLLQVPLFYSLLEYTDVHLDHMYMESHIDFLLC